MSKQEIQSQIDELELELEKCEYGSYTYDVIDSELQFLYIDLDKAEAE